MKNTPHYFGMPKASRTSKNWFQFAFGGLFATLLLASCSQEELVTQPQEEVAIENPTLTMAPLPEDLIEINDLIPLDQKATEAAGVDRGRYNISLRFVAPVTDRQKEVFDAAIDRWERIIIEDKPSVTPEEPIPSFFLGVPPITGTIDDIVIEVALIPIDGPFGILGAAGPQFVRSNDFLTLTGVMFFDTADLALLDSVDLFEEVIVHEMGHVLGFGTLWNVEPFFPRTLLEGSLTNPYFSGRKANVFWNAEGGTGELPIESMGGPGTAFGHWQESTLGNELMTGFIDLGENPLSRITSGSMRDLGYGSASVGESYDLPRGTPGVDPDAPEGPAGAALHIAEMEELLTPIGIVITKKN